MVGIKTSNQIPKIYEEIRKYIPHANWDNGIIICYGDTIHCKYDIPASKLAHESVHVKQQEEYGVDKWWNRYLKDLDFRRDQELIAYKFEADFIKRNIKDREARYHLLHDIAKDFSSPMYGNIITFSEVMKEIL